MLAVTSKGGLSLCGDSLGTCDGEGFSEQPLRSPLEQLWEGCQVQGHGNHKLNTPNHVV